MATNSYAPPTPEWVRIAIQQDEYSRTWGLHIGVRARDGDVTLFHRADIVVNEYRADGPDRTNMSQRQILEHVIETATNQLAILALEEK